MYQLPYSFWKSAFTFALSLHLVLPSTLCELSSQQLLQSVTQINRGEQVNFMQKNAFKLTFLVETYSIIPLPSEFYIVLNPTHLSLSPVSVSFWFIDAFSLASLFIVFVLGGETKANTRQLTQRLQKESNKQYTAPAEATATLLSRQHTGLNLTRALLTVRFRFFSRDSAACLHQKVKIRRALTALQKKRKQKQRSPKNPTHRDSLSKVAISLTSQLQNI